MAARHLIVILCCLTLAACGSIKADRARLSAIFQEAGFQTKSRQAGSFTLREAVRYGGDAALVWMVIAGDGHAYIDVFTPAPDPTPSPKDMPSIDIALSIARLFPNDTIIHLTRPCQFLPQKTAADCPIKYWTRDRFGPRVRAAYLEIAAQFQNQPIIFVGWSGGGVISAHLAADHHHRNPKTGLLTLAAPLRLADWTSFHKVTPLPTGDDPAQLLPFNFAHLIMLGQKDRIVPAVLANNIQGTVGVAPYAHHGNWHKVIHHEAAKLRNRTLTQ